MRKVSILLLALCMILPGFAGCMGPAVEPTPDKTDTPSGQSEKQSTETPSADTPTPDLPTADETPSEEPSETPTPHTSMIPEDGVLKLLADGKAPGAVAGKNPSFAGEDYNEILAFFDFAFNGEGLDLADDTEITYKVKKGSRGQTKEGTSKLDTASVKQIKTDKGYIGVCFPVDMTFDKFNSITVDFSFKDKNGKEYTAMNKMLYKGIQYYGITDKLFKDTNEAVTTVVSNTSVVQKGKLYDTNFSFTISLLKWECHTKPEQISVIAKLFWYCFPRMYHRYAKVTNPPTDITLAIEDEGYGIAWASGDLVHIHDQYLMGAATDYDCLTHEFGHIIQGGWDGRYCEYDNYIETFADVCRYQYAFNDGAYNDDHWTLSTDTNEDARHNPIRFIIWFDYFYSTPENDLLLKWAKVNYDKKYTPSQWANAWAEVFDGTELEGKTIDEIWQMYAESDFVKLSSKKRSKKQPSELLQTYDIRGKLTERGLR